MSSKHSNDDLGLSDELEALFDEVSRISEFNESDSNLLSESYLEELDRQHQKLCILSSRL